MMDAASISFSFFLHKVEFKCEKNQAHITVEQKQIPLTGYDM